MTEMARSPVNPLLKLVLEMGPLVLFFLATVKPELFTPLTGRILPATLLEGERSKIFTATAIFMPATVISLAVGYGLTRHIPIMPLISGLFVIIFGALTLWQHNDDFIMIKTTIVNTLFGVILLGGLAFGHSLVRYVLDAAFNLHPEGWRKLSLNWGLFFLFLAALNEIVRVYYKEYWATFKVFGIMPITLVFAASQLPVMLRYEIKKEDNTTKSESEA